LVSDYRNHLWGFLAGKEHVISEWDGKTWTDHALPEDFDPLRSWNFGLDIQNRVWLLSGGCRGPVTVLNIPRGSVEVYQNFAVALQTQLPNRANFHIQGDRFTVSTITSDGRIGYRDPCWQAHYFDGQTWRVWKTEDIEAGSHRNFDGPAYFDRVGNFAVNISGRTWEFSKNDGWHLVAFQRGFGTDQERSAPRSPSPPPGCEAVIPESVAQDRLGTFWLTSHGQLYRAVQGLCAPQFSPGQSQPFVDSRTIKTVSIDPEGNAFLETYLASHGDIGEYVIVNARPPLPQTSLRAIVDASGIVSLRFETQAKGRVRFTWKVDGGDWSSPSGSTEARLDGLADGTHRIEAAAIDDRLQIESTPAVTEVAVHVDTGKQLGALIEQLKDPDYSVRNAAVEALVRQPEKAFPLLQSARVKAGADQRWWIDASIQQIEQNRAKQDKP
jgi:hypothetical protein